MLTSSNAGQHLLPLSIDEGRQKMERTYRDLSGKATPDECFLHTEHPPTYRGARRLTSVIDGMTLLLNEGFPFQRVTIKVAAQIEGCAEQGLYRYFADRHSLLSYVACRDHHRFADSMRRQTAGRTNLTTDDLIALSGTIRRELWQDGRGLRSHSLYLYQSYLAHPMELPQLPSVVVARENGWVAHFSETGMRQLECRLIAIDSVARDISVGIEEVIELASRG